MLMFGVSCCARWENNLKMLTESIDRCRTMYRRSAASSHCQCRRCCFVSSVLYTGDRDCSSLIIFELNLFVIIVIIVYTIYFVSCPKILCKSSQVILCPTSKLILAEWIVEWNHIPLLESDHTLQIFNSRRWKVSNRFILNTLRSDVSIETPDSLDYFYYPITKSKINVSVRAAHDARICLRTNLTDDTLDAYEIIIGGCDNKTSFLKNTSTGQILREVETEAIVSEEEYSYFQIQWFCDGYVSIKFENEHSHILSYHNKEPFPINYIGFSTAYGATGEWTFDEGEMTAAAVRPQLFEMRKNWIDYEPSRGLPLDAVSGDGEDDSLFIGRSRHKNSLTPGIITNFVCRICWGGHTHDKRQFQVLCGVGVGWAKCCNGAVPMGALPAGETENGLALFVGRVIQNGRVLIGKVQPNHQVCYVPVDGREVSFSEYYVLVVDEYAAVEWVGR